MAEEQLSGLESFAADLAFGFGTNFGHDFTDFLCVDLVLVRRQLVAEEQLQGLEFFVAVLAFGFGTIFVIWSSRQERHGTVVGPGYLLGGNSIGYLYSPKPLLDQRHLWRK